jgi:penicillin-binding protein 2
MFDRTDRLPSTPMSVAMIAALAVFAALAIAAFRLQVVKYSDYKSMARDNYIVQVSIKAPRGDIVDRNGALIAGSRQAFSICAVPRSILRNKDEMRILSRILGIPEQEIRDRLAPTARSYRPTVIVRDADFATLSVVEESFADLRDVMVIAEPVRSYPLGRYFSHMVGYVGEVTEDEMKASPESYDPGDFIGKSGIEKQYEADLRGLDGVRYVNFTPGGGTSPLDVDDLKEEPPQSGKRITLCADKDLQECAFELLEGRRGCIVVMDVRTGGVLAMASSPSFDPDLFAVGISGEDWREIAGSMDKPLINRAMQSAYPPGSTFKIVSAAMALEEGIVSEHTRFEPCRGSYKFGNRTFGCWKAGGHGSLDLVGAIRSSCDIYFYQLGERLSADMFGVYASRWRLSERTGVDLPAEVKGLVPDARYFDRTYGEGKWSKGIMLNLAIGQGEVLLTPLELLCFVGAVADNGCFHHPRCVDRVEADGRVERFEDAPVHLEISASTLRVIKESMLEVVESDEGTGRAARIPGLPVAGKTGTAQNPHGEDHASFVCFAPFDDPEIAMIVLFENAGHGGSEAAPAAHRILTTYFGVGEPGEVASR